MMTMDVATSINTIDKTKHEKEIEEDEGKIQLAASIGFPLSKITQQNNAKGVKMCKHKLKSSHKPELSTPPRIPRGIPVVSVFLVGLPEFLVESW